MIKYFILFLVVVFMATCLIVYYNGKEKQQHRYAFTFQSPTEIKCVYYGFVDNKVKVSDIDNTRKGLFKGNAAMINLIYLGKMTRTEFNN